VKILLLAMLLCGDRARRPISYSRKVVNEFYIFVPHNIMVFGLLVIQTAAVSL